MRIKKTTKLLFTILLTLACMPHAKAQSIEEVKEQILAETSHMSKVQMEEYLLKTSKGLKIAIEFNNYMNIPQQTLEGVDKGDTGHGRPYVFPKKIPKDSIDISFIQTPIKILDKEGSSFNIRSHGMSALANLKYKIKKVFFKDGSTLTSQEDPHLNDAVMLDSKPAEQLEVDVTYNYPSEIKEVKLSLTIPFAIVNKDTIKLEQLDKNVARIRMSEKIISNLLKVTATTQTGDITNTEKASSGPLNFDETNQILQAMDTSLDKIVKKIKQNAYDNNEAIVDDLVALMMEAQEKLDTTQNSNAYWQGAFDANIASISIFLANKWQTETFTKNVQVIDDQSCKQDEEEGEIEIIEDRP